MEQEQINEGNILLALFMGAEEYKQDGTTLRFSGQFVPDNYCKTHAKTQLKFHCDWNWIMPVIRRIVEISCEEGNEEIFESNYYNSVLDTVPVAIFEDVFKVAVEFVKFLKSSVGAPA